MLEIWRTAIVDGEPYKGFEVSNLGRVKSLNYRRTGKQKLMKIHKRKKDGYLQVKLRKNGKTKTYLVHRLIAETFLPNPEGKLFINHKIEGEKGKTMNMVIFNEDGTIDKERTTIEWVTRKENNDYGTRKERVSKTLTNGKLSKRVLQLSLSGELIREWPSTMECKRNGFNQGAVAACCRGELPHYKGFLWMYK